MTAFQTYLIHSDLKRTQVEQKASVHHTLAILGKTVYKHEEVSLSRTQFPRPLNIPV